MGIEILKKIKIKVVIGFQNLGVKIIKRREAIIGFLNLEVKILKRIKVEELSGS